MGVGAEGVSVGRASVAPGREVAVEIGDACCGVALGLELHAASKAIPRIRRRTNERLLIVILLVY